MQIGPKIDEIWGWALIYTIILYYKVQLFHTNPLTLFHPGGRSGATPCKRVFPQKKTIDGNSKKNCIFLNVY